jgi:hypothetical protein
MLVSTCRTGTGSSRKFVGGLSDARWKIVESAADDIGMCSLVWRRGVSGAVLCKAIQGYHVILLLFGNSIAIAFLRVKASVTTPALVGSAYGANM